MPKRVFIIHGWGGYPEEGCFPQLKKSLENHGLTVFAPAMPEPLNPKIDIWVSFLKEWIGVPDKDTVLFGHSIGAQTILRYLESLGGEEKIGGAVFLAGWINLMEAAYETEQDKLIAKPWLETPLDWGKIKSRAGKFTAIFSDDDKFVPLSDSDIFREKLGAKIIVENGKGHFSGEEGVSESATAIEAILEITI